MGLKGDPYTVVTCLTTSKHKEHYFNLRTYMFSTAIKSVKAPSSMVLIVLSFRYLFQRRTNDRTPLGQVIQTF